MPTVTLDKLAFPSKWETFFFILLFKSTKDGSIWVHIRKA